jgi:peptidoglycan/xylan/chitin deacetylase (PgdA/CDA1 family)
MAVTTSWDDGYKLDRRVAAMLERAGVAGTFYIAPRSCEIPAEARLTPDDIRSLASGFEIGGHTLTHVRLPRLGVREAAQEIRHGKYLLEDMIQSPVRSFCYPRGEYRPCHLDLVRQAGFSLGRTVRRHETAFPRDPLQTATTVHAYRHWRDVPAIASLAGFQPAAAAARFWNWDDLAIALFDRTLAAGGLFHLWGHSWEIDAHDDWGRLERVLRHIGGRTSVRYITNGDLIP